MILSTILITLKILKKKEEYLKPQLIKTSMTDYDYNFDKMFEDLDAINFKKSGNSIKYFVTSN